jgi:hypothetical protein
VRGFSNYRLDDELRQPEVAVAAQELLRQALVMTWGSLEVLVSDLVRHRVNDDPLLGVALLTSESTRKYFGGKAALSIDVIAEFGFNLSKRMGDAVFGSRRLDALNVMSDTLKALYPAAEELHRAVSDQELWLLNQRRHLIVHRRALVDRQFLNATGLDLPLAPSM